MLCGPVVPGPSTHVAISPLDIRSVAITGGPFAQWQRVNRQTSFRLGMKKLQTEGNIDNLRLAAGLKSGEYRQPRFMDGAIYKMLEAAAWEFAREPDPELQQFIAEMTDLVSQVQDEDGYINSYYQTVSPGPRYSEIDRSHEIYLAGLLALAGIAVDRVGLGDRLLGLGRRFADHVADRFTGSATGGADGHPGAEFAMVELYRHTNDRRYLELAESMIDKRGYGALGARHGGSRYLQDHLPVRDAQTVAGHAVRAMYLDTGVVDLYLETGETALFSSSVRRWEDLIATKTAITGGIGSRHSGEAFGDAYELPPDRAYNESCAAFAAVFWNWRLLLATGQSRYADMIERLLYNAFAASTSYDGSRYFYVNPLQRRPDHFEHDDPGHRHEWYSCPCCPPNIMRLVSSLSHYVATKAPDGLTIQQYVPCSVESEVGSGRVCLDIRTDYPWQGRISVRLTEVPTESWSLALRMPGWVGAGEATLSINDESLEVAADADGYLRVHRGWQVGDVITLDLAMPVRFVAADPRIDALRGCVAIERGPLVYCLEQVDQPDVVLEEAAVDVTVQPQVAAVDFAEIGRSVAVELRGTAMLAPAVDSSSLPYQPIGVAIEPQTTAVLLRAVPYYQWDNREPGSMRVWIPIADKSPSAAD